MDPIDQQSEARSFAVHFHSDAVVANAGARSKRAQLEHGTKPAPGGHKAEDDGFYGMFRGAYARDRQRPTASRAPPRSARVGDLREGERCLQRIDPNVSEDMYEKAAAATDGLLPLSSAELTSCRSTGEDGENADADKAAPKPSGLHDVVSKRPLSEPRQRGKRGREERRFETSAASPETKLATERLLIEHEEHLDSVRRNDKSKDDAKATERWSEASVPASPAL